MLSTQRTKLILTRLAGDGQIIAKDLARELGPRKTRSGATYGNRRDAASHAQNGG